MISQFPRLRNGYFILIMLATDDGGETPRLQCLAKATPIPEKNNPAINNMYLLNNSFLFNKRLLSAVFLIIS